jgi:hypothetical protein
VGRAALFWLRWIAALLLVAPGAFLYATGFMYTEAYAVWAALGLYVVTSLAFAYRMASTGRKRIFIATA